MSVNWIKNVKEGENRIYINNDCTQKEREQLKSLKAELIKRKTDGEANLRIDYKAGKIVTFLPKQDQAGSGRGTAVTD